MKMAEKNSTSNERSSGKIRGRQMRGFSLLELVVALAVFTIVAGTAFDLVVRSQPGSQTQMMMSGLNIGLRNAVGQMQIDLANAGTGTFGASGNQPSFPIGITIQNQTSTTPCNNTTSYTYGASCFDSFEIITADTVSNPSFQPLALTLAGSYTTTSGTIYATPQTGDTAATDAAYFHSGDEVLLVQNSPTSTTNGTLCPIQLTAAGSVSGTNVKLVFTPTAASCVWSDPLGIANHTASMLSDSFNSSDWVIRLDPISYSVDTTSLGTSSDPKLVRTQGGATAIVADQIIGLKVGAALWDDFNNDWTNYIYNPSTYTNDGSYPPDGNDPYNYTLVQAVRVTLIGRTTPMPSLSFRNEFDNGPYNIQAVSFIVNPRNLSMNDQ